MKISIVIPTCNRKDLLAKCLDCLNPEIQTYKASVYEVVVTDDSKDDSTKNLVELVYPWVKWVAGPKRGPAANRNNGAKNAGGDWLIFIDDDCLPDKNLVAEYHKTALQFPETLVFEGCIKADREKRSFVEESPVNLDGGHLWSCNFMIYKHVFKGVGGFDEGFPYAAVEDVDFNYRLKLHRIKTQFVAQAFVVHPWRIQNNMSLATKKRFKSLLFFLTKHPEKAQAFNATYYLRISFRGIKSLFTDSYKFRFRGIGGRMIYCVLHFYYAFHLLRWQQENQRRMNQAS